MSAQNGSGGDFLKITSSTNQAPRFAPTIAPPMASSSQNQRVRPWLLNAAHSIAPTATIQRLKLVKSEKAERANPGFDTRDTVVYDTNRAATAAICQYASRFM